MSEEPNLSGEAETLNLTYGVELEFVFAFREEELDLTPRNPEKKQNQIIKDIGWKHRMYKGRNNDYSKFTLIDPSETPGRIYNSWGVQEDGEKNTRPYETEPMDIAAKKLCTLPGMKFNVEGSMNLGSKTVDKYQEWLVTVDHSVCGRGSQNIPTWLPKVSASEAHLWDSYGLELVSRVFNTTTNPGDAEICNVIDTIKGNESSTYGSFTTNQTGLHVHVQAPEDLSVLKELAMILLIYEDEISRLHSKCRRPNHPATAGVLGSNRTAFMLDDLTYKSHYPKLDCSTPALAKRYSIPQLRGMMERRFKSKEVLSQRMNGPVPENAKAYPNGTRHRLVNFTTTCRKPDEDTGKAFPSTIEFRHAQGSLDSVHVLKWIEFCVGLVRLAHEYASKSKNFRVHDWGNPANPIGSMDHISVWDLIEDMGLPEESKRFWKTREAKYSLEKAEDIPTHAIEKEKFQDLLPHEVLETVPENTNQSSYESTLENSSQEHLLHGSQFNRTSFTWSLDALTRSLMALKIS